MQLDRVKNSPSTRWKRKPSQYFEWMFIFAGIALTGTGVCVIVWTLAGNKKNCVGSIRSSALSKKLNLAHVMRPSRGSFLPVFYANCAVLSRRRAKMDSNVELMLLVASLTPDQASSLRSYLRQELPELYEKSLPVPALRVLPPQQQPAGHLSARSQ